MTISKFPLILSSIAYALGIILASYITSYSYLGALILSTVILIGLFFFEKYLKHKDYLKTSLIIISILVISTLLNFSRINLNQEINETIINTEIVILKTFNRNLKFQNSIVEEKYGRKKYLAQISLVDSEYYKIGESLFVTAEIEKISQLIIPNNFDFTQYLKRKGIENKLVVNNRIKTSNDDINSITISSNLDSKINNGNLKDNSKGLLKALVLGRKDDISDELISSFSDSGIMHLLALSGLHIGILTWILSFLLKPIIFLKNGTFIRSIILVILLWAYAYITGFSSSIIRATIMFSMIVIGNGLKRQVNIYNSLAIAALILLLQNPNNIFDVGFQLSFSAVIGIVWMFPIMNQVWKPKFIVIKYFWELLLVSFAAQIATLPLTIYYFHKFSGLFFIANIIEIPAITLLLGLSYLYIVLLFIGVEANWFNFIYDKTVVFIEYVSMQISSVESMIFNNIFIDKLLVLMLSLIIVSILLLIQQNRVKYIFSILILLIMIQLTSIYKTKNISDNVIMMMANDEVFFQNGHKCFNMNDDDKSIFSNYIIANNIVANDTLLDDVFVFNKHFFWEINSSKVDNPISTKHTIIVNKNSIVSPEKGVNSNTTLVIYSGYKNSYNKNRWEYYCLTNNITFHSVRDSLYVIK